MIYSVVIILAIVLIVVLALRGSSRSGRGPR